MIGRNPRTRTSNLEGVARAFSVSTDDLKGREKLERVMNSIRNGLGMGKTEIAKDPSRAWNPHFYAVFAQVHNTL